jgi:hypothetical protein
MGPLCHPPLLGDHISNPSAIQEEGLSISNSHYGFGTDAIRW